jgi:hypothetical protein
MDLPVIWGYQMGFASPKNILTGLTKYFICIGDGVAL